MLQVLLFVYVLFLLFQLKTHSYLYESTPQEAIDEESHPGVLANVLGSGSSSSSSEGSTSSDSDDSSHSRTATKRFRRALRNRRRRKSTASSKDASSLPSAPSFSAMDRTRSPVDGNSVPGSGVASGNEADSRRGSGFAAVMSGDEADTDGESQARAGKPRGRDSETEKATSSKRTGRKHKKRSEEKKGRHHKDQKTSKTILEKPEAEKSGAAGKKSTTDTPARRVGFDDNTCTVGETGEASSSRQKPTRPAFRSALLSKVLTETVFNTPPNSGSPDLHGNTQRSNLLRASSLPEMNKMTPFRATALPPPAPLSYPAEEAQISARSESDGSEGLPMSRTAAVITLFVTTGVVAVCAEFLLSAIPAMTSQSSISQAFIGLIILPIIGNAAEHVTAVKVAAKNKMDLAIGVAVGSSIQMGESIYLALFLATPTNSCESSAVHTTCCPSWMVHVEGDDSILYHLRDHIPLRDRFRGQLPCA